jgi:hypothetical protein
VLGCTQNKLNQRFGSHDSTPIENEGDMVTWPMDTPDLCRGFIEIGHLKIMYHLDLAT